ncbi:MAG TPA: hypothetical protein VF146_07805 [Bryobacteraceae bacterium]
MKRFGGSFTQSLVTGLLVVAPIYLAILLLLKATKSLGTLVKPLAALLPQSFPAEPILSFLAVLTVCLLVGVALRTQRGQALFTSIEHSLLQKVPGYEVVRGLTRQLAGQGEDSAWRPALAEIEDALVPAFIVEELADGRMTVFVPSVPTPFAGAIYILSAERVHPLNIPFAHAIKVITRWGSGSKELVNAMHNSSPRPVETNYR